MHAHAQGPLSPLAASTLSAIMGHVAAVNQQPTTPPTTNQPVRAVAPRTLHPPPGSVAAALRRVIDSLGSSARRGRRATKVMPFLGLTLQQASAVEAGGDHGELAAY